MVCELTIKDGKFVYDLNAMSGNPWNQPPTPADKEARRWTTLKNQGFGESHWKPREASLYSTTGGLTRCRRTSCRRCSRVRRTRSIRSG